jgi:predicted Rossmann fold flavoprotein
MRATSGMGMREIAMFYDCIIIGGGAAGMTAAAFTAKRNKKTLLLERGRRLGSKLLLTGRGRCNLTNNCSEDEFFENIPTNPRFLRSAYSRFTARDCMDFFEGLGVPLKTERGGRVFPVSDKASDVVSALERAVKDGGVTINHLRAGSLLIDDGQVKGVYCSGCAFYGKSVLVATGGKSYPKTGSDGDGYAFALAAGHRVTALLPSLSALNCEEDYCAAMEGLSLKNVDLTLIDTKSGKRVFRERGEMLFTSFGISGPLVLSASSHIRERERGRYKVFIDLKPALDEKTLDKRLLRDFGESSNKLFRNALGKLLPKKAVRTFVALSGIPPDKPVNAVTRAERCVLVELLKAFPLTVLDFRPIEEAVITSGGVDVTEINPKTMESKLIKGLFLAGEVIDVDAYTGGFNLQIAFSTAVCAAENM